ncbi:heme-binding protein [Mycobacterium sp. NPDC003323]
MKPIATLALAGLAASMVSVSGAPAASAAPPCSASNLATVASGVLAQAGGYLDTHPSANDVLTAAANQPTAQAEQSIRGYFLTHPGEFLDLQNIARPLIDLRRSCGVAVSPGQLAALIDALS